MKKLTPIKSIRKFCVNCMGGSFKEIKDCCGELVPEETCVLAYFRFGKNLSKGKVKSLGSIKKYCLSCVGGVKSELEGDCLELATEKMCPLNIYKFGKNPSRKGLGNKSPGFHGVRRHRAEKNHSHGAPTSF